ncbi:glutathione metabolism protein [Microvirga tunisiensis]|uniref:Glutathione metabolism protein n=2 Tax=Pannonibacter tanglangensis TaxID=2750084 RepID=A0ABW9ZLW6_9HYPH|nr:glutathione metabolism protein [Pannonibacter sp. XCT-34]NBN79131.1 glutathione metabolism protein [Pannonibacter sp. XCT-53]
MMVTPVYAALLALLFLFLSYRVIARRNQARVALGHGGDADLTRRVRVHANFAEYVPFALLLLALCELQGAPFALLHGYGAVLLAGRLSHAYGVSQVAENLKFRMAGMIATFGVIAATALTSLYLAITG